ncbi:MAG TPA: oligosaccharide flippase family protein [Bacteroidia bacterium]|nr:oligosaccharide flippase family protein [Bacteroidia bacterium]
MVQKKKFIFDLAILLILNLLIKPFWILGIEPQVQLKVGDVSYGEYAALFNFSLMMSILLDFGLTNFNNKNIAQHTHLLSKHFSKMLSLKFVLALVYAVFTLLVGMFILKYDFRYMKLLLVLCANSFFLSFILFLRSNLLALHLFRVDSILSVLDRVIMIFIVLAMLLNSFGLEVDIMNFVYAQTLGYALTAGIGFFIVLNKTHTFKLNWDWSFNRMILKKSFPFAILVLLMTFYNRLDSVMLERILPGDVGKKQTGIYAKAFRLLDAANMIAYLFSVQLLPLFSRMIKNKENIENIVKLSFTLLITPALIISVSSIFYSDHFYEVIYKGESEGHEILGLLMCCFTAISTTYIFGTLLTANGNLKFLNLMAIGGIVVNLVLNFVLIPRYHAMGSAVASVITQFVTALIQVYLSYKVFNLKLNSRLLLSLFFFIIGIILANYFTLTLTGRWMLNFLIMLIFSVVLAFATGMVNPKSFIRFVKYK